MLKKIILISTAFVLMALMHVASAARGPEQVVKDTFDQVVSKIQTNRELYQKDTEALHAMLENTLVPSLNVPFMIDLILGKELATTTPEAKQAELAEEFKKMLLNLYATGILYATGDEEVVYEPVNVKPGDYRVDINLKLVTADNSEFPIKLQMTTRKGRWSTENTNQWRAYNLEVAGQNIARLYRATFASTLKTKGVDGLIESLRAKSQQS